MKPSLFVCVPRTASSSMREALATHGLCEAWKQGSKLNANASIVTFNHRNPWSLRNKGTLSSEWLSKRWKFAFIRNPWDRMVSLYEFLFHVLGRHRERYGELSFAQFVEHVTENGVDPIGDYNWSGLSQANQQTCWLTDMDFVGRFEHLQMDWNHVCNVLDIDAPLPNIGGSDRKPYKEYYTRSLRKAVAIYYHRDIAEGQYEFD